ncbi:class I SAM-dependent methyltransferase [Psychrobacillus antarcticus]|uniref:class I SAM-dependent methyltransferase n=1 Tax=Psychrobacillus antarcticus TaxID=2879115 RepID=UPI0024080A91|nr:class I SAM-dependent methyltransferase [Psychrobacillus antarcticus]
MTAIDNHPIMAEKARQRFKKMKVPVKVKVADVQKLNFGDNSFDLIIAESVIVFTDISSTLKELSRVLKSDGKLIMIEMTAEQYLSEEKQKKACKLYGINEILDTDEWILRLYQAGFTQVELINTPSVLHQSEISDINPSIHINMDLYELWEEHNEFMLNNRDFIGYRAFKCHKS